MSSILSLKREPRGAMELRRGSFEIVLDGRPVGSIGRGQTAELQIEPGAHALRVTSGRYSSRRHEFSADEGEKVLFRCDGAILWPQYVASLVVPDIGLRLKRQ